MSSNWQYFVALGWEVYMKNCNMNIAIIGNENGGCCHAHGQLVFNGHMHTVNRQLVSSLLLTSVHPEVRMETSISRKSTCDEQASLPQKIEIVLVVPC